MRSLVMALFAEGATDERFLRIVIQRTAENIIMNLGKQIADVIEPIVVNPEDGIPSMEEKILSVARQTAGYHALIIHLDADHPTPIPALEQRFQPGYDRVQAIRKSIDVCDYIIPLIPVQMTESWMLADIGTLRNVIGTDLTAAELELPTRASSIESLSDPKNKLQIAISKAHSNSKRKIKIQWEEIHTSIAQEIDLDSLKNLVSYQKFSDDLTNLFIDLKII